jgi:hypothetical protein
MYSFKQTISQFYEEHHNATLVIAAATWGIVIAVLSFAQAAEPLSVGGLPVT